MKDTHRELPQSLLYDVGCRSRRRRRSKLGSVGSTDGISAARTPERRRRLSRPHDSRAATWIHHDHDVINDITRCRLRESADEPSVDGLYRLGTADTGLRFDYSSLLSPIFNLYITPRILEHSARPHSHIYLTGTLAEIWGQTEASPDLFGWARHDLERSEIWDKLHATLPKR